jgi:hypothetical protein
MVKVTKQENKMAKLEWRSAGNQGMNIADFRDTAFIIEFDGPGTFIAYQRDYQFNCKEHIREYRDAVLWCQEQADRMEDASKLAAKDADEIAQAVEPEHRRQASLAVFEAMATEFGSLRIVTEGEHIRVMNTMVDLICAARVQATDECIAEVQAVQEEADRNHENGESSGAWACVRALTRKVRIEKGEDPDAVDSSMKF